LERLNGFGFLETANISQESKTVPFWVQKNKIIPYFGTTITILMIKFIKKKRLLIG
jgi:hypothetical protein